MGLWGKEGVVLYDMVVEVVQWQWLVEVQVGVVQQVVYFMDGEFFGECEGYFGEFYVEGVVFQFVYLLDVYVGRWQGGFWCGEVMQLQQGVGFQVVQFVVGDIQEVVVVICGVEYLKVGEFVQNGLQFFLCGCCFDLLLKWGDDGG